MCKKYDDPEGYVGNLKTQKYFGSKIIFNKTILGLFLVDLGDCGAILDVVRSSNSVLI